eukprot:TRINITY_DN8563_c0_g1_i2.p1 TRINITY_DN8563_c0_g1~~TRINITY_DN8563_c0_g1_i2.p1  ORF type:complete len:344 (-),score=49.59 TRINITY_DN8563_c0_g1_i2:330-1322(-)
MPKDVRIGVASIIVQLAVVVHSLADDAKSLASTSECDGLHTVFLQHELFTGHSSRTHESNNSSSAAVTERSLPGANISGAADLSRIYCWAIVGVWEETITHIHQQMQQCGDHVLLSNFSDPDRNVSHIFYDDMSSNLVPDLQNRYWANVTLRFVQAWKHIVSVTAPNDFDWFVKVDADTFLRPRFIPKLVAGLDPSEPMALATQKDQRDGLRLQGPIEIISNAAVYGVHGHGRFFDDHWSVFLETPRCFGNNLCWFEDEFVTAAVQYHGGRMVNRVAEIPLPCTLREQQRTKRPSEVRRLCLKIGLVAIHPVKSAEEFEQLQYLDEFGLD